MNDKIIQFSPPRSGSTLLWNFLRVCLPDKNIIKTHSIENGTAVGILSKGDFQLFPVIISVRDPFDRHLSCFHVGQDGFDYKEFGWIINNRYQKNILILKYEDYVNDYDYMIKCVGEFLKVEFEPDLILKFKEEFNRESVLKRQNKTGSTFDSYDKKDHIHGGHISYKEIPKTGSGKLKLTHDTNNEIMKLYGDFISVFGYQPYNK